MSFYSEEMLKFADWIFPQLSNDQLLEVCPNVLVHTPSRWEIFLWEFERFQFYHFDDKLPEIPICQIDSDGCIINAWV